MIYIALILFIIQIASHGGLGGGDVKFSFVLGLFSGSYDGVLTIHIISPVK